MLMVSEMLVDTANTNDNIEPMFFLTHSCELGCIFVGGLEAIGNDFLREIESWQLHRPAAGGLCIVQMATTFVRGTYDKSDMSDLLALDEPDIFIVQ